MANTVVRRVILDLSTADSAKRSIGEINKAFGDLTEGKASEVMLKRVARRVEVFHIRPMMSELKEVPPKRTYPDDYPIEYKSEQQERFVRWLLGGKPYQRTNRIVNGWGYKVRIRRGRISIEVANKIPEFKFVVGLIGTGTSPRSIKRYLKPMQPFHMKTGWKPAHEIITEYVTRAKEDSVATIRQWLQQSS